MGEGGYTKTPYIYGSNVSRRNLIFVSIYDLITRAN